MKKSIEGYEGLYSIDTEGNLYSDAKKWVRGFKKETLMKPKTNKDGYHQSVLQNKGKIKTVLIHRLVAKNFIPNPDNKPQVNHINGIKNDNRVENLEWCTSSENIHHAWESGLRTQNKGSNPNARKIIDTTTGFIYNSIVDAKESCEYSYSYLYRMLSGKTENKTTLKYF